MFYKSLFILIFVTELFFIFQKNRTIYCLKNKGLTKTDKKNDYHHVNRRSWLVALRHIGVCIGSHLFSWVLLENNFNQSTAKSFES